MSVLHVVLLTFRESVTDAGREKVHQEFRDTLSQIDGVESVEIGKNFSGMESRFTDMGVLRLRNREALAAYAPHELHQAVGRMLANHVEDGVVLDIEV